MPSGMSSFNIDDSTASVIFPHFFPQNAIPERCLCCQHANNSRFPLSAEDRKPIFQRTANIFFHFGLIHERFLLSNLILFSTSHFAFHSYLDFPSSRFSQKAGTGIAAHTGFCYCLFKWSMLIQHLRLLLRLRAEHASKC